MTKALIVGGAGFIGANTARRLQGEGYEVSVVDNLSRPGAEANLEWLRGSGSLAFEKVDIRDDAALDAFFAKAGPFDLVIHLAAQVAVTTSVTDPRDDFLTNALGTFNVLEAVRLRSPEAAFIFSSTNKVYGGLEDLRVTQTNGRYTLGDFPRGVGEDRPLDFHSPYGCSKGAADQYTRDYARIYGLRTVTLRQSCIYGPRQFGVEDQGWVAWFTIASVLGAPVTIYGDGRQVRDVLEVGDLVEAFLAAYRKIDDAAGRVYNVGGGPDNTMSLLELLEILEALTGRPLECSYDDWRPGDQKVFVSNLSKIERELGWRPKTPPAEGVEKLWRWVSESKDLLTKAGPAAVRGLA